MIYKLRQVWMPKLEMLLLATFKRGRITLDDAEQVLAQFTQIPIRRTQLRLTEAVRLAHAHDMYAYDAYVLDCARQYPSTLLSLDNPLRAIAQKLGITLLEIFE